MTQQQTTTFTPGPWGLAECSHGGVILVRGADYDAQKRHEQSHLQILPMADARLIAAAPDLYAAGEAVVAAADDIQSQLDAGEVAPDDRAMWAAIYELRAALRRARGEG